MKRLLSLVCIALLTGCAIAPAPEAIAPKEILVKEGRIYVNEKLYAEVIKIYPHKEGCRGIAIYYVSSDRYEWISPKGGLQFKDRQTGEVISDIPTVVRLWDRFQPDLQVLKNLKPAGSDGYFKKDWRYDVAISPNGDAVYYCESTANSLLGCDKMVYKVVY